MPEYLDEFKEYAIKNGVGKNDVVASSIASYVSYLKNAEDYSGIDINKTTLRSKQDVKRICDAVRTSGRVGNKTLSNYTTALNTYVGMVEADQTQNKVFAHEEIQTMKPILVNASNIKKSTLNEYEWIEAIQDEAITNELNIKILQAIYSFKDHKAAASQIGSILGYTGKNTSSPLNLEIGRWGSRLAKKYELELSVRKDQTERKWDLFFDGYPSGNLFIWKIKGELVKAMEYLKMTGDLISPDEIPFEFSEKLFEGAKRSITVNAYERNDKARKACIEHYGPICSVCSFSFKEKYGDIGEGFIHVHHLTRLADIGSEYEVNPIKDLRPICPNCHAMLHMKSISFSIEELKQEIQLANKR